MEYLIEGGKPLKGELHVYGAKNCALALLGATVLTDDEVILTNCPDIVDVENMLKLLSAMGKTVTRTDSTVSVKGALTSTCAPVALATLLRGSALILGGTLARHGEVTLPVPGGCAIGARPMDIHLCGFEALGATVTQSDNSVNCRGKLVGARYTLRMPSVGATENLLCACALAKGDSVLKNCATEPEVAALEQMLVQMGAKIRGAGGSELHIEGVSKLHGTQFFVIPDRIVAATYLAGAAATLGDVTVTDCVPQHLGGILDLFRPRFDVFVEENSVRLRAVGKPRGYGTVQTAPYPAFPTDMQSLLLSLAACSVGKTVIRETLFENRLAHNAEQLNKMGAQIEICGDVATVVGANLHGACVEAKDLRGGAGLVIAALAADGVSKVGGVRHIERGYIDLGGCFAELGAKISKNPFI